MNDFIDRSRVAFWGISLGVIVLFLFLVAFAGLGISEVAWLSVAVLVLLIAFTIHTVRLARTMRGAGRGDVLSRSLNSMRERRGF
jgi:hypothetical protein